MARISSRVQHGQYAAALEEARRLAEGDPEDAALQRLYRDTQVAYILDQGRQAVFRGELNRGLELLEEARSLDPENPLVDEWILKIRAQLASYWLDRAAELKGPEQLDQAELAYEKVLEYEPENLDGKRGLAHVLLLKNYRSGQSKSYFDSGLASFRELLLDQARRAFQISQRYRENEPAAQRGEQVEIMLAQERLAQAKGFEEAGLFNAARNEYRLALLTDPENEEARDGFDRMDREVRANHSLAAADMEIRRGKLDEARETLDEADNLTVAQQDHVSLLESGIEEKTFQLLYDEARNLETDYRYPEAVAAYERLLSVAPDFADAGRRRTTIQEFIRLAEELYKAALEATSDEEAEGYLRAIQVPWPEYRDVPERLRAIEERRKAAQEGRQGPEDGRR